MELQQAWKVDRHSGRDHDVYRVKFTGDETRARKRFAKIKEDLRQGEVRLWDADGNLIDSTWAPRLRTRW